MTPAATSTSTPTPTPSGEAIVAKGDGTAALSPVLSQRLMSLDACRGAVMLLMASSGLGFAEVARQFPESRAWAFLAEQSEHAAWVGCRAWDLIQPAFMFMVGVAVPWSVANRLARGGRLPTMFAQALWRAVLLVVLSLVLGSAWSQRTDWGFNSVLAQIGLGYPFLFLLAFVRPRAQAGAAAVILLGYWLLFALHPVPSQDLDLARVGLGPEWSRLTGFAAHWEKNVNAATSFDRWFLNLFPRETPYVFNRGGYQTLNFVPSLATMTFGLLAGGWLRTDRSLRAKVLGLIVAGVAGIAAGYLLGALGICPVVKRIWTPSWALLSGGWVALILAAFVLVIEGWGWRRWAFPCVVAGLNPITLYCLWQLLPGSVAGTLKTHLGPRVFEAFGAPYAPIVQRAAVLVVFWLVLWWMHRRRLYIRL